MIVLSPQSSPGPFLPWPRPSGTRVARSDLRNIWGLWRWSQEILRWYPSFHDGEVADPCMGAVAGLTVDWQPQAEGGSLERKEQGKKERGLGGGGFLGSEWDHLFYTHRKAHPLIKTLLLVKVALDSNFLPLGGWLALGEHTKNLGIPHSYQELGIPRWNSLPVHIGTL